jgi:hypothetical protein
MLKDMMKRFSFLLLALAVLAAPVCARAAEVELPPILQKLKNDGAKIEFMGHSYGADGWRIVMKDGEDAKYAYTTPEGGVLLGILLRPDGTSETNEQLKALKAKVDGGQGSLVGAEKAATGSVKSEKLYAAVEKSAWARTGDDKAPYLYLFVNMLCDHCQSLWKSLEGPVKSGKLQVRIVPFGKVEQNRDMGAALLSADDPAAAWNAVIRGDQKALAKDKIKPGTLEKVDANTALFRDWTLQGPPFTIYRRPTDGQITVVSGEPDNIMLVLADLVKG